MRKDLKRVSEGRGVQVAETWLEGCLGRQVEYWRARSISEWLKYGDRNTTYFHIMLVNRRIGM